MTQLILQVIIRQWDKSQQSEQAIQARNALPDRYPVKFPPAKSLFNDRVVIDQHGDDLLGNRLSYQLVDNTLLIDRFRLDLTAQTVEFKSKLSADTRPIQLTKIDSGWQQFHYQWRYRTEHQEQIFWLYESVILNIAYSNVFDENIFVNNLPGQQHNNLLNQ